MPPNVVLSVEGQKFEGWTSVRVRIGLEQIAGEFELSVTELWSGQWSQRRIKRGDPCTVMVDSDTLVTGYVDDWMPSYDATQHTITVTGRDKTGDLVDCSAIHQGGSWSGVGLLQIANDLTAPFGISTLTISDVGAPFKHFSIQEGETVFEALSRAAKMRGLLLLSDGAGHLILSRSGMGRHQGRLGKGENILSANGQFSFRDRYSTYIAKGQRRGTDDDAGSPELLSSASASIVDEGMTRYRPLIIIAEDQGNAKDFSTRATWERNVRVGKSIRSSVRVQGWRDKGETGNLWTPNLIVPITDSWQGLNDDLLIAGVEFTYDQGGTIAQIELTNPSAFNVLPIDEVSGT